jgi:hypothetical protein
MTVHHINDMSYAAKSGPLHKERKEKLKHKKTNKGQKRKGIKIYPIG